MLRHACTGRFVYSEKRTRLFIWFYFATFNNSRLYYIDRCDLLFVTRWVFSARSRVLLVRSWLSNVIIPSLFNLRRVDRARLWIIIGRHSAYSVRCLCNGCRARIFISYKHIQAHQYTVPHYSCIPSTGIRPLRTVVFICLLISSSAGSPCAPRGPFQFCRTS